MTPAPQDPVLRWVRRLNALAIRLDETAGTTHPSAWREQLAEDQAAYKKLAAEGPR